VWPGAHDSHVRIKHAAETAMTEVDILNIFNAQVEDLADNEALERARLASLLGATHTNLDPTELVEFIHFRCTT
jgi:hypothetical protein